MSPELSRRLKKIQTEIREWIEKKKDVRRTRKVQKRRRERMDRIG